MNRTLRLGLALISLLCLVPVAQAADPVTISSLQAYPEAYKMKVVQVTGMVSGYQMHHFIGSNPNWRSASRTFRSMMAAG